MIPLALALSAVTALVSFLAATAMRRFSGRLGFTDLPNDRSSHTQSTPRAGGAGFALAVPIVTAYGLQISGGGVDGVKLTLLVAAAGLAGVGLADDRWRLHPAVRLLAQFLAAAAVVAAGGIIRTVVFPGTGVVSLGPFAVPLTVLWLVGLTNIYNFMDGIDGLAASQAIVAAGVMGGVAVCLGHRDVAIGMTVLGGGAAGFLVLNRPPASVFMGDVGSTFLGFTLAGWAVISTMPSSRPVPLIAWLGVLSPFLFDASCTLLKRLWRRERIHEAHRSHFYQRLVTRGWTHGRTTALYAMLASLAGLLTFFSVCFDVMAVLLQGLALSLPLTIPVILRRTPAESGARGPSD
jgi:UDP-N-acetylmuramyl pentapeptide phosphotransferase/UDP-N-acetylglucosamine-1-phosphate transferase